MYVNILAPSSLAPPTDGMVKGMGCPREWNMRVMHAYACICIHMHEYILLHVHIYICMHGVCMQAYYACKACMHLDMHVMRAYIHA